MGDLNYISSLLRAQPGLYLDELQSLLHDACGVQVSIATLSRSLARLCITNKTVSTSTAERDELLQSVWQADMAQYSTEQLVAIDESSVDDKTYTRGTGWSPIGRACIRCMTFLRGQHYSLHPALTSKGMIAMDIFKGSVTKDKFVHFLRTQLVSHRLRLGIAKQCLQAPKLNPYPQENSVVLLDNCAIHHDEDIRAIVADECGALPV